jgi:hypothetical protein
LNQSGAGIERLAHDVVNFPLAADHVAERELRRTAAGWGDARVVREVGAREDRELYPVLQFEERHRAMLELLSDDAFSRKAESVAIELEGQSKVVYTDRDDADSWLHDSALLLLPTTTAARTPERVVKQLVEHCPSVKLARALKQETRYDGKYVLRTTTTELAAEEVAHAYKDLTWIERLWRELKDVVELRPIFRWRLRQNVKGHIFSCFLALHVAAFLRRKLGAGQPQTPLG